MSMQRVKDSCFGTIWNGDVEGVMALDKMVEETTGTATSTRFYGFYVGGVGFGVLRRVRSRKAGAESGEVP